MTCQTEPGRITSSFQPDESEYRPVNLVASSAEGRRVARRVVRGLVRRRARIVGVGDGRVVECARCEAGVAGVEERQPCDGRGDRDPAARRRHARVRVLDRGLDAVGDLVERDREADREGDAGRPPTDAAIEAAPTSAWMPEESVAPMVMLAAVMPACEDGPERSPSMYALTSEAMPFCAKAPAAVTATPVVPPPPTPTAPARTVAMIDWLPVAVSVRAPVEKMLESFV